MLGKRMDTLLIGLAALIAFGGITPARAFETEGPGGPIRQDPRQHRERLNIEPQRGLDIVRRWNRIATDADAIDHAGFLDQAGPTRSSRALAIVHIAIFDAVNAIAGGYRSYTGLPPAISHTSLNAAVAQAGHDTLAALYPSQRGRFDRLLRDDLRRVRDSERKNGIALGQQAAEAILDQRKYDGSEIPDPPAEDFESLEPGRWRRDPVSQNPIALGAYWGSVTPFALNSSRQFRPPSPPGLASRAYTWAFQEVKRLGGVGEPITATERTVDQTLTGIFWSYDGTPFIGSPPRQYNQKAMRIADRLGTEPVPLARLLALVNVAMADAAIGVWEAKYHYLFWRPVTAIREAGTDGNRRTRPDPGFTPLGAQASNLPEVPDFTPPFPSYPSGHSGLGEAMVETLRLFYGTDRIAHSFVSDELNGKTLDFAPPYPPALPAEPPGDTGNPRPLVRRFYDTLTEAEQENGRSRIYLGVHWNFDVSAGNDQGQQTADFVFRNTFYPTIGF